MLKNVIRKLQVAQTSSHLSFADTAATEEACTFPSRGRRLPESETELVYFNYALFGDVECSEDKYLIKSWASVVWGVCKRQQRP